MRQNLHRWLDSLVNRTVLMVVLAVAMTATSVTLINSQVSRQELETRAGRVRSTAPAR